MCHEQAVWLHQMMLTQGARGGNEDPLLGSAGHRPLETPKEQLATLGEDGRLRRVGSKGDEDRTIRQGGKVFCSVT